VSAPGHEYWRSLEELAETPEFTAIVEQQLPRFAAAIGVSTGDAFCS
jgi:MoCo/4Fe-4S cofactor protein with predicted Tat translocation signal